VIKGWREAAVSGVLLCSRRLDVPLAWCASRAGVQIRRLRIQQRLRRREQKARATASALAASGGVEEEEEDEELPEYPSFIPFLPPLVRPWPLQPPPTPLPTLAGTALASAVLPQCPVPHRAPIELR